MHLRTFIVLPFLLGTLTSCTDSTASDTKSDQSDILSQWVGQEVEFHFKERVHFEVHPPEGTMVSRGDFILKAVLIQYDQHAVLVKHGRREYMIPLANIKTVSKITTADQQD
ncbi:hypothetical protein [Rubritalea halochordaticola]